MLFSMQVLMIKQALVVGLVMYTLVHTYKMSRKWLPLRLSGLCENIAVSECQQLFSQKTTSVKRDTDTLSE